jgi:hypothetical protein
VELPGRPVEHRLRARIHVDRDYARAHAAWPEHFQSVVLEANVLLEEHFHAAVVLDSFEDWNHGGLSETLVEALTSLEKHDPGSGEDLVIGLVGPVSLITPELDALGTAEPFGSHLVLRARIGGALEIRAEAATLVHELGHIFGAVHDPDEADIMHESLTGLERHFSEPNASLVRRSIAEAGPANMRACTNEEAALDARARACRAVMALRPDDPIAALHLVVVLMSLDDPPAAATALREAERRVRAAQDPTLAKWGYRALAQILSIQPGM